MTSVFVAPDRGRALLLSLWVLWLLGLATFLASTVLVGRDSRSVVLDTWLYSALALGAAALAVLRPVLVERGRVLWSVNALALLVYAAGDLVYSFYVVELDPEPYPSVADALWLSYYVFAVVFLVALLRTRARGVNRSTAVDGVVVGLGAAAATAAVSFDTIRAASEGTALETAASLGYPVGALVLLGTAGAALAVMGWRVGLQWWALVLGGLVFAAADTVYAYLTATTGYTDGTPLDALWLIALGLQAAAAWLRPRYARHAGSGGVVTLVLPLAFAGAALFLLVLEHFQTLSLLALVLAAATVAAALLRITITVDEVRQLAVTRVQALTDELTGLPNRRSWDHELERSVAHARRFKLPVAVAVLDVDRFKDHNDGHGHAAGDALLVDAAQSWSSVLREVDTIARWGGDEFGLLITGCDAPEAAKAVERVRAMTPSGATCSAGLVVWDGEEDEAALMARADRALYAAKRTGRDRLVVCTEPAAQLTGT